MTDATDATPDAFPTFTYYPDPIGGGAFHETQDPCPCCGEVRGWGYVFGPYCPGESPENLCPWCIADGSASEKYGTDGHKADFTGDLFEIRRDDDGRITEVLNPFITDLTVPQEQWEELSCRTPRFLTWQEPQWLACCSTPAQYLGQPTGAELKALDDLDVPGGVLDSLRATSHWGADGTPVEARVDHVGPDASEVVYLFRCSGCGRHLAYSDND